MGYILHTRHEGRLYAAYRTHSVFLGLDFEAGDARCAFLRLYSVYGPGRNCLIWTMSIMKCVPCHSWAIIMLMFIQILVFR